MKKKVILIISILFAVALITFTGFHFSQQEQDSVANENALEENSLHQTEIQKRYTLIENTEEVVIEDNGYHSYSRLEQLINKIATETE